MVEAEGRAHFVQCSQQTPGECLPKDQFEFNAVQANGEHHCLHPGLPQRVQGSRA